MKHDNLPLFNWMPIGRVIVFPMTRRSGRIRDVAFKMLDKPTERATSSYRNQVTATLVKQLGKAGLSAEDIDQHVDEFWSAVETEMDRLAPRGNFPDGGHVA